jgi:hypothetical protein
VLRSVPVRPIVPLTRLRKSVHSEIETGALRPRVAPGRHNNRSYLFFDCCFNARAIGMEESLPRWREQLGGRMAARFVISVCSSASVHRRRLHLLFTCVANP